MTAKAGFNVLVCLTSFLPMANLRASPPAGYYLVWNDEFNGTSLDTTKWDYWLLGNRRDAVNIANAVSVGGGYLTITTYTSNNVHYTAMIATDQTFRSRYGYWESTIAWGDTNGMWSAYWMQSPTMGTYLNDPFVSGSEIDIVEHRYVDGSTNNFANIVQNNIHWNGYGSAAKSAGSGNIGSGLASGFHTYGFLWTPSVYTLYVDGANLRSWNYANNGVPVSQSTEWAILSSEVDDTSTTWAGYIPAGGYGTLAVSTTKLTADYVRYYAPTSTLFWTGTSSVYLTNTANWISNLPPVATSDLTFSYLSGNNLSPALGQDLSVDGLVFLNLKNGITVGGVNTLTLGAGGLDMVAANHTVTINCPVSIGANQTWLVGPNNPGNTLNMNGPISGAATLTKGSYGTLILNGTNSFSGTFNVDTSSTTTSDGIVRVTRSQNLANAASPIMIRNNNGGSSTLGLDGTLGSVTIAQDISLAGRNTNVVAIANYAGSNTISGNLILTVGGANYWLDSDSGTLNFTGLLPSSAAVTSSRTFTFMGAGNIIVSGVITNAGTNAVNVVKTNAGTLTLFGANTYRGTTTVSGGSLFVNGSLGTNTVTVAAGLLGGNGTIGGPLVVQSGATLSPGGGLATLTVSNSVTLQSGSTTLMEIRKTPLGNDHLVVDGALALGGNLVVNNLGGTLNAGDSFPLFRPASLSGAFNSLSLPTLNTGLAWNTNVLTNGVLAVMSTIPPNITNVVRLADGSVQLAGVGSPGVTYQLLATTNLSQPGTWVALTNAVGDGSGVFQFTDQQAATFSQRFYRIVGP